MTAFLVLAALLAALAAAFLTRPLWWPRRKSAATSDEAQRPARQLKQLEDLHAGGVLTDRQYAEGKREVESRLAAGGEEDTGAPAIEPRRRPGLAIAMAAFVFVFAMAGYLWVGSPGRIEVGPGSPGEAAAEPPVTPQQVAAMVDKLVEHLKAEPDDAQGWFMLARAYVVMGQPSDAVPAFKKASELKPNDADLLADYADALAVMHGRRLDGEPARLIERALKADPANPKALALAGTVAFDRKDYAAAAGYWEALAKQVPADGQLGQQIQASLTEARRLAGVPVAAAASASPGALAGVSGTVTLAPALKHRVAPDDTVFVFARAARGSPMPLAVMRKKASDLPLQFRLDDSTAMSADAKLSGAGELVVGARISKSGNPLPQPGDLQAFAPAAALGASGVRIEIDTEVGK